MILWSFKLISHLRKAVAGRRYPSQLAWATAFGFLLGVVPHGNLMALALLIVVLSLKLNHAMAGLVAVVTTLLAPRLDPVTHSIGQFLLMQPKVAEIGQTAWALPLVPWTDLNNSIVLGSLVLGSVLVLPVFIGTYPLFRLFKPHEEDLESPVIASGRQQRRHVPEDDETRSTHPGRVREVILDGSHRRISRPHRSRPEKPTDVRSIAPAKRQDAHTRVDGAHDQTAPTPTEVETRIDVIRMTESESPAVDAGSPRSHHDEMDEALNYLLRQLRDSQQKEVA